MRGFLLNSVLGICKYFDYKLLLLVILGFENDKS